MIDNHKASVNTPGQIVGYIAHDPEANRWRVDVNGGAWVSVRADNLQDAMSLALVADQIMKLIPQARTQPGLTVVVNDGLTELCGAIGFEDNNIAVVIAGMVLDAETRIESLELLSGAIEQGNPPAKGSGPWPVWPATSGSYDVKFAHLLQEGISRAGEEQASSVMNMVVRALSQNRPRPGGTTEYASRALRICSIYRASGISLDLLKTAQGLVEIDTCSANRWFGEDDAFATVDLARRIRDTLTIAPATAKAEAR